MVYNPTLSIKQIDYYEIISHGFCLFYKQRYKIIMWEMNLAGAGNSSQIIITTLAEVPGKPEPAVIEDSIIEGKISIKLLLFYFNFLLIL